MTLPAHLQPFWAEFGQATARADETRFYDAFCFGDSEALATELAGLVLQGRKRATTASVWSFEAAGRRLPQRGDLSIVTDAAGQPLCVIETQSVDVMPFSDVTAEFAAAEGEGDGSLDFWRTAHISYFSRECAAAGREFSWSMRVACERFELLWAPSATQA